MEARISAHLDAGSLSEAAVEAVRGYGPQLLGYLLGVLRDEEAARDAFAAVCEDIWSGLGGFRRECSFRTWAYRLAWNRAQQMLGSAHRRRVRRLESGELSALVDSVRSLASRLHSQAARGHVARLREALDAEEQTLLTLRVDRELSWSEVGEVLSLDEAVLRKRFERIKDKLRALAEREGLLDA